MSQPNAKMLPEAETRRFLRALTGADPATFQTFDDSDAERGALVRVLHGTLDECIDELDSLNRQGAGVFVTVNATDGKGRKAENVSRVRAVFVDLDGADPEPARTCALPPHMFIESSPGRWHAYWRVEGLQLEQFKPIQKAIAARFNGDPSVCDLPRVMRCPGFNHNKGAPFLTHITEINDAPPYTAGQIEAEFLPVSTPPKPKPKKAKRAAPVLDPGSEAYDDAKVAAEEWLMDKAPIAVEGQQGNATALQVANQVMDRGVTEADTLHSMLNFWNDQCSPPWGESELARIVRNASKYRKTEIGSGTAQAQFEPIPAEETAPETSGPIVPRWVEDMNARYFVVNENGVAVVYRPKRDAVLGRNVLERLSFDDLKKLHLNDNAEAIGKDGETVRANRATTWLKHPLRRQYLGGVVFAPGQNVPDDTLNLWTGYSTAPKLGKWGRLRNHIREIICGGEEASFRYVLGWMARAVQLPGEQGEVALVLRGGKGTGKGTLGHALRRLFGQYALYVTHAEHLTGRFNSHLLDAVFIFADEAFFAGNRAHEGVLKGLVTDPVLMVEGKFQKAFTARNVAHVLMASNSEWIIPATAHERRFCVLDVSDAKRGDFDYFKALHDELDAGGIAAMLHDLLQYDLTGYQVRDVPQTAALADQKALTRRGVDAWWADCLHRGKIGMCEWTGFGLTLGTADAHTAYVRDCKDAGNYGEYRPAHIAQWKKEIKKLAGECCRDSRPQIDGKRIYQTDLAPLGECRAIFEQRTGAKIEWATGAPEGDINDVLDL
jgi:hypothetical protein